MENQIMKALYYLRKNQIALSYRLNPEKSGITASQAYAWSHDCYPYFHVDDENDEAELYLDYFKVKKDFVTKVIDYSGAAEPPIRKNGSHHSRPREPPIYSSFVWSNSACCCRAGFHKPVRASRLPTSSLEAHTMLRTAVSGFIQP